MSGRPPAVAASSSGEFRRHPVYRGIRSRRGKWIADIRVPGKQSSRIWLGTYRTPEMAAAAYDAAALALNWPNAVLNFPDSASTYPIPASLSAADIQVAAAAAASASREPPQSLGGTDHNVDGDDEEPAVSVGESPSEQNLGAAVEEADDQEYYVDEEELFRMPSLLEDMAQGMLISPPRTTDHYAYGSPEGATNDFLWSYE